VTFTNESTGTFPLAFEWDLGDGVTSTLPAPTHTYQSPGLYTVVMTATDLCGSGVHSDLLRVGGQLHLYYLPLVTKE
jgi:PKD repeat protein